MSERATITFVPTSKNKISDDISFLKACVNMFKEEGYENLSPEARKLAEKAESERNSLERREHEVNDVAKKVDIIEATKSFQIKFCTAVTTIAACITLNCVVHTGKFLLSILFIIAGLIFGILAGKLAEIILNKKEDKLKKRLKAVTGSMTNTRESLRETIEKIVNINLSRSRTSSF